MSTQELVAWVIQAQDIHEKSWEGKKPRCYSKTMYEAIDECRPATASDIDMYIARILITNHWNECQDWHKEFSSNT